MKNKLSSLLTGILTAALLLFAVMSSRAQIIATNGSTVIINNFDTSDQVTINDNLTDGGVPGNGTPFPWGNWFGAAFSNVVWSPSDAGAPGDNSGSGSMLIESYFPDGGVGGVDGTQFVVFNGFGAFNPPFNGYGTLLKNVAIVTNFTCDIRFDPITATNANGTFPTVEFGTYGNDTNYGQWDFGSITLQATNTNWVHVSIPLAASSIWTNIPSIYVKIFSTLGATGSNVPVYLYVDNLEFQQGLPSATSPDLSIQKATSALRIFANGGQYARTQIATVDTNQSWVGGSYPVSYSFTISAFDPNLAVNEFHAFWIPLNFNSGTLNQYSDYSTAQNTLRLLITQGAAGGSTVVGQLAWKTNLLNSNPNNIVTTVTNNTGGVGTWTVTFSSATAGTLTAPGDSPVGFTINDANITTDFGNPVVYEFGMQPDPTTSIGSYVDVTHAQTVNVASPGVPVNSDLTTGSINTNTWLTGSVSTANGAGLVPVSSTATPWWTYWTSPAIGFGLGTKGDVGNQSIAWKTPNFYANYPTNGLAVIQQGIYYWELIPSASLPTVDGTSNGVKSANAFFRLSNPPPAQ